MPKTNPQILEGQRSWPWYRNYLRDPIDCLNRISAEHDGLLVIGNPIPFDKRRRRYVFALGEEANRTVFSQPDLFKPGGQVSLGKRNSAQRRLRNGLLSMHGDQHRHHRKVMQPPFSKPSVTSYVPTITRLIDQVLDRWVIGEPFDMYAETTTMANWIAAHILFDHENFEQSVQVCELITRWIYIDNEARRIPFINIAANKRLLRHAEVLEQAMHDLISEKRQQK